MYVLYTINLIIEEIPKRIVYKKIKRYIEGSIILFSKHYSELDIVNTSDVIN